MAGLLTRQRVLAAKIESVAGTAEVLSASDAGYNVYSNGPIITANIPMTERPGQSAFSRRLSVPGAYSGTAKFSVDLCGLGSSGATPAWASAFLPPCGMLATGASFAFVTGSTSAKTLTISAYEDGTTRTIYGAVGTWTINLKAGERGTIDFEFTGIYGTDADVAILAPTYPTALPPRWANTSGITYDSYSPLVADCVLSAGNSVKLREDANAASGYKTGIIVDRTPTFSFAPESELVATKNWMTYFLASTAGSLAVVVGTVANNVCTITYPKAQVTSVPNREDRVGLLTTRVAGIATRSAAAGDDECTIAFT